LWADGPSAAFDSRRRSTQTQGRCDIPARARVSKLGVIREDPTGAAVNSIEDVRRQRRLDEIVRAHGDFLRRLAVRLCRSTFDPDDLVQDVLERTLQNVDRLPADVDHRAWMARVMRNLFIDRVRRRASAPVATALEVEPSAPPPEQRAWWEQLDLDDVRARLGELPDELRGAFELFALEGCSYTEIAARLGIPKATVGTRILRARRKLRDLFLDTHGGAQRDE
jgi:RNA polymerase sigma-70 factor, ECF subfamily